MPHRLFAAALVATAAHAAAEEARLGDLAVRDAWIAAAPATAGATAGYMTLVNEGATPVRLVSVASDAARRIELHATEVDADGVARMIEQAEGVAIPAGSAVAFEPGGLHVMFMGLTAPFGEGESVSLTLVFDSGELALEVPVAARGARGGHGHGHGG